MQSQNSVTVVQVGFPVDLSACTSSTVIEKVCKVYVKLARRLHLSVAEASPDGKVVCCYAPQETSQVLFESAILEVVQAIQVDEQQELISIQLTWHHPGNLNNRGYRKRYHFVGLFNHAWRKLLTHIFVENKALIEDRPKDSLAQESRIPSSTANEIDVDGAIHSYNNSAAQKDEQERLEKQKLLTERQQQKQEFLNSKEVRRAIAPFNYEDEIRRKVAPFNYPSEDDDDDKNRQQCTKQANEMHKRKKPVATGQGESAEEAKSHDWSIPVSKRLKSQDEQTVRKAVAPFNYYPD